MTKAEQFLWCVQTALLNNQLAIARQIEGRQTAEFMGLRHVNTVTARALWAAPLIPDSMSASDAANEFCAFAFDNLWHEGQPVPSWMEGIPK